MKMLTLSGITKTYGTTRVVDTLDLELEQGEFLSLLGPSGCGKTTTLRMIAGFITPSEGAIVMNGRSLHGNGRTIPPEKRQMSMIFQSYALWPNMTVEENVGFGLRMRKVSSGEAKKRVQHILDVVQLGALAKRAPNELSGGQQQRVALARALVVQPEVLLLDEPLSNLDANLREDMRREIRRLHDEFGTTSIYVTHDQSEAMTSSDRIAVMNKGRIEQIDVPTQLYARPQTRYVAKFIGRSNILSATTSGSDLDFGSFVAPNGSLGRTDVQADRVLYSLRTQSPVLHEVAPDPADRQFVITGQLTERTYLGEHWEYVFQAGRGGEPLRISAPSDRLIDLFKEVWVTIDARDLIPIKEDL